MDKYSYEKLRVATGTLIKSPEKKKLSSREFNKPSLKEYPARRIVVDESLVQSVFIATEEEVKKLMDSSSNVIYRMVGDKESWI